MTDICCIGHITEDAVITPEGTYQLAGGTAYYFSMAISCMPVRYRLITRLALPQLSLLQPLRAAGIAISLLPSADTVYFENNYLGGLEARTQRVLRQAEPFLPEQLDTVFARYFHLGPLLAGDIPAELIRMLAAKGRIALDVQGLLRTVEDTHVRAVDWAEKQSLLPLIDILKLNEAEMEVLTGTTDPEAAAARLKGWGAREILITLGSRGAYLAEGSKGYWLPAFPPRAVVDATGCGDTFMAGYLCRRALGEDPEPAGRFASAMASLKLEQAGAFCGTATEVWNRMNGHG